LLLFSCDFLAFASSSPALFLLPLIGRDVRIIQYETGSRSPREDLVGQLAGVLEVSPNALTVPDIDSYIGIAHTLFTLEDLHAFKIDKLNGELCIRLDSSKSHAYMEMVAIFNAWQKEAEKFRNGEITKEQYDRWRYRYPEFDTTQVWVRVPSQEISDVLNE